MQVQDSLSTPGWAFVPKPGSIISSLCDVTKRVISQKRQILEDTFEKSGAKEVNDGLF